MQPPCWPYPGNTSALRASRGVHNKEINRKCRSWLVNLWFSFCPPRDVTATETLPTSLVPGASPLWLVLIILTRSPISTLWPWNFRHISVVFPQVHSLPSPPPLHFPSPTIRGRISETPARWAAHRGDFSTLHCTVDPVSLSLKGLLYPTPLHWSCHCSRDLPTLF